MEKLYINQRNKELAEVIMGNKINELVKGYNELMTQIMVMKSSFNVDIDDKILKELNATKAD